MNLGSRVTVALLILGCATVARAAVAPTPATAPATTTAPATSPISLPSFGMTVPLPRGYARDVDTEKSAVMIVPTERVGQAPQRAIMVNVMAARGQSFDRAVDEALRTSGGMVVVRKDAQLGGERAVELGLPAGTPKPDKPRTMRSLMLEREDYLFLLGLVGTSDDGEDRRAFDDVAAGTVWGRVARAAEAVASREPALLMPGGGFAFDLPDPFRPEPAKQKNAAVFVARDLPSRVAAARLTVTVVTPPQDGGVRTLGDFKVEVDRTLAPQQWRVREPLLWSNVGGAVPSVFSQPTATQDGWVQAMLVLTPDGRRATVFALQCRGSLENAGRLDQVIKIIRASMTPIGGAAPATAPAP
jgi:hypothetical protein